MRKMMKKLSMILAIAMMFTLVFAGIADTDYTVYGQMEISSIEQHIIGADQYETAYKVAKLVNPNPSTVIIVRGDKVDGVPQVIDGLTASGIAGMENASILLVEKDHIPGATREALQDLKPNKGIIIGGTSAVSENVENELRSLGIQIDRLSGRSRVETAANVARKMGNAEEKTAIIVDGNAVVDSLVAGPLAHKGYPILMVNNNRGTIPEETKKVLAELKVEKVIIVGGYSVVSEDLEKQLNDLTGITVENRYGGRSRVQTSLILGEHEKFSNAESVSLVNGLEYVDAVAASTLGVPMVYYIERSGITEEIQEFITSKGSAQLIGGKTLTEKTEESAAQEFSIASNIYRSGFNQEAFLEMEIRSNEQLRLEGKIANENRSGWLQIRNQKGERVVSEFFSIPSSGSYKVDLPLKSANISNQGSNEYEIRLITGADRYSTHYSAYTGIMMQESSSGLKFQRSYVYNDNLLMFQKDNAVTSKDLDLGHLKSEDRVTVGNLAKDITKGQTTDYAKVKAVHDWVAKNVYYDYDGVRNNTRGRNDTMETLDRRIAVCQGYAELTASLLRSIDIPARLANGYALGVSAGGSTWETADLSRSNHAWNEAYVDGRWIVMDATWDSGNRFENGKKSTGTLNGRYFDMSLEAFSITHMVFNRQRTIFLRY